MDENCQKIQHSSRISFLKRLFRKKSALAALVLCLFYLGMAVFAEGYGIYCSAHKIEPLYQQRHLDERFEPPSRRHWLGTDYLGRDVFLRAVFAAKTAVKVGVTASLISALVGVSLGILAGYYGGKTDDIAVWIYSTFASMPSLLFILAFALLVSKGFLYPPLERGFAMLARGLRTEPGMLAVYLGIGLTGWVALCRVVRAETMKLRERQYIMAAKALGLSDFRILMRHILPNLAHLIIVYFTMRFAFAVMTEVIVSYLGLGVQFEPSWGVMIADGPGLVCRSGGWNCYCRGAVW